MIRTDIDIKDYIYSYVSSSDLAGMVSGKVYKDQRPLNSDKEDIIISVLARDAGSQIQDATINVNIYVPDIRRGKEAIEDGSRLRTLCAEAAALFEYFTTPDSIYQLDSQAVEKVNGIDYHLINNRIRARFSNETT